MEPGSLTLQADSLLPEPPGKLIYRNLINFYWYSILLLFYNFLLLFTEFLICSSFYSFLNWQLRPLILYLSVQFSHSVVSDSLWPMNCSTPGLHVHHQLLEFTQTHVHRVGDAIQPFHPLSSPSPPAPNPSQHQSLVQWVKSSHEVAKVLEFQL